jgi:hypothetical protein
MNVIAGGPAHGYRHLVDSSLDWGQDLPDIKRYIDGHPGAQPAFLSYFGVASPDAYRVPAQSIHSVRGGDVHPPLRFLDLPADQARQQLAEFLRRQPEYQVVGATRRTAGRLGILLLKTPAALRLSPGTYFISASMLQPVMYEIRGPVGPWNRRYEGIYQSLYSAVKPLLGDDPAARDAALATRGPADWAVTLDHFDTFRFARLTAYLRRMEPVDTIDGSVLVYRLGKDDIARAVDGPPPELGADLPVQSGVLKVPAMP